MDLAMINPFVDGTLYILDTTASLKARPGEPSLKRGTLCMGDISGTGILSITGDVNGLVSTSFTQQSILGIVSGHVW